MTSLILETLAVGIFQSNVFILGDADSRDAIVIDPGDDVSRILDVLNTQDLRLKYILLTHGHIDHIGGVEELKNATGGMICMHEGDLEYYNNVHLQASFFSVPAPGIAEVDTLLEDGMEIGSGELSCRVIHTPGHTPGSVSFYFSGMVFTGDALFRGSIGRTDLWGGSHAALMESIKGRLLTLDDKTDVYPGHGPATTIGIERRENPFIQETGYGAWS